MKPVLAGIWLAALMGVSLFAGRTQAQETAPLGEMTVADEAKIFSSEGIERAKSLFDGTNFQASTHYTVVTRAQVPSGKQAELDAVARDENGRGRFFATWARELGRQMGKKGVLTMIFKNDKGQFHVVTISDAQSDLQRSFSDAQAKTVTNELLSSLRRIKDQKLEGNAAQKEMDDALIASAKRVSESLKDTKVATDSQVRNEGGGFGQAAKGGNGIMSFICIGLAVMLGIWLVVAFFRAIMGGGGGGYGGGGGGGFGGGGFFPSLLGGLFGAAAGMYLYDSFMGGNSSSDAMASDNGYNDAGNTGEGDWDGGGEAGGGDWGDDGGAGGDWGGDAGGGDFGGDFGGGDW